MTRLANYCKVEVSRQFDRPLMFRSESTKTLQPELIVDDLSRTAIAENDLSIVENVPDKPKRLFAKIRDHEWITGLLYGICDMVCWVLLYGVVGYVRRDAFFVSAFEFVLVDCISLLVLLQALYIVGGYSRNTETRGLTYTAEHILAVTAAALISSFLIYSSAAYDAAM